MKLKTRIIKVNGKDCIKCSICSKKRMLKFYYYSTKSVCGYTGQCKSCYLIRDKQYKNQMEGVL